MSFNPCIIIPCYNHGPMVPKVLELLKPFGMPIILVDDGSDDETKRILRQLDSEDMTLLSLPENQGKGGAVIEGIRYAGSQGFTHGIQIDADGQHDLESLPKLVEKSQSEPDKLISGKPLYDDSVPSSRLYGRYITHVWVWIETLSLSIKDSMCGSRSYPIEKTIETLDKCNIGTRMDFDTEIMVRMYWEGVDIDFVDIRVIYPEDGLSHFDVLKDNLTISKMHTKLFFGMLPRIPKLLWRKLSTHKTQKTEQKHWSTMAEKGSVLGIKTLLFLYSVLGRTVFNLVLKLVMSYYYMTGKESRTHSQDYLSKVKRYGENQGLTLPGELSAYNHFVSFGKSMLDKLAAWKGDIQYQHLTLSGEHIFDDVITQMQGIILLGSHHGNLELCRALSRKHTNLKINALVFTEHAEHFNTVMKAVNPDSDINLIQVQTIGPDTAILLQQKLELGEWIVIVGDRTSTTQEQRVVWADFLGEPAPFPQGPFLLASALKAPVFLIFGLRDESRPQPHFNVYFEKFADKLELPRGNRESALQGYVQQYAMRLQHYVLEAPLQWYNFFNFWKLSNNNNDKHNKE
ncbi:glycosyltransferase [Vibrio hannami]|uniref:glycosyltransferase family 2 protein n=1 Tax=Vibrio hannami TaxID=2717094 RepID=UPI00240F09A2|nr:glycosyltransferase family 2 protein [Vibrio hannami]MDG3087534.1 glycosyltransferase [Vibrio hannami]